MNPIELDLLGYAAGRKLGHIARQRHEELLEALKTKSVGGPYNEIRIQYTLLAMNGYDLKTVCPSCKAEVRFPPEYGGETTQCIHCKRPLKLILSEEIRWIPRDGGFTTHLTGGKFVQALIKDSAPPAKDIPGEVFHSSQSCKMLFSYPLDACGDTVPCPKCLTDVFLPYPSS